MEYRIEIESEQDDTIPKKASLQFPRLVTCRHCDQVIYGCVCCVDFDDPDWWKDQRYGTLIDGFRFDHANCVNGREHEPREESK